MKNSECFHRQPKHSPLVREFSAAVARTFNSNWNAAATRRGRMSQLPTLSPSVTQNVLLKAYGEANNDEDHGSRYGK